MRLKKCRKFGVFMVALLFMTTFVLATGGESKSKDIEVYVDSKKIDFDVEPSLVDGRTLVPMRKIFEELGAEVKWDDRDKKVVAERDQKEVAFKIGEKSIYIDGREVGIDTPAVLKDGRTLVPVRFISEAYDLNVQWLDKKKEVRIYTNNIAITNGEKEIELGESVEKLRKTMGNPARIDEDLMNTVWYIYNNTKASYKDFIMVGVRDNRVVAFKTNSIRWKLSDDIRPGKNYRGQDYYRALNDGYMEKDFYIEVVPYVKGNTINSIAAYEMHKDYHYQNMTIKEGDFRFTYIRPIVDEVYTEDKIENLERQVFDLTNVIRVNKGLSVLSWNDDLARIAKNHSEDMGSNNYFGHASQKESFDDRMQKHLVKYNWDTIGENLVLGAHDSIGYVNAWYNSDAHRVNLLSKRFDKLGIGACYNQSKTHMYFTQNFAK